MTLDEVDRYCRSLPASEVRYPFQSAPDLRAWCVGKRMYAWAVTTIAPLRVQIKAHPGLVPALIRNYDSVTPGYHMNKRHWITVDATACEDSMLMGLLEDAHSLVAANLSRSERLRLLSD